MPIAPLMIEHRLIEKMARLLGRESQRLQAGGRIDLDFNKIAVDFFRTYADQLHHGKEEQILFRELKLKKLSSQHRQMMEQFIEEHVGARSKVKALEATQTEQEAMEILGQLAELYPKHIEQEDKRFFVEVMEYFSKEEQDAMLEEGRSFDRGFDKEKYKRYVEDLTGERF